MKLIRYRHEGKEKPGVLLGKNYYDVSNFGEDYNEAFFENDGLKRLENFVEENKISLQKLPADFALTTPFCRPSKIVCIGLNYAKHAKETGLPTPTEPVIFLKATTALAGPNDNIRLPQDSKKTDWEVELCVVIEKKASYVSEAEAMNFIAGYCVHNDLSERAFQLEMGGTWDKGKGCDTFAPMGPFLATKNEINDPHNLRLWLSVNGTVMQDGHTSDFIFNIPFVVSYVSRFMTLLPGDVISTGTPAGVALSMTVPQYLKAGDVIELGIDGLGTAKQKVIAFEG